MEARLMPHAQYIAVVILVDGQARAAQAFEHQTDALRWAEAQRLINASAPRLQSPSLSPYTARVVWAVTY
jgi:hypothetical protein